MHYTDAYSAYGPIVAADEGVSWFTLRNAWDPGARYMPDHRRQLREARARHRHREATCGPLPPLTELELAGLDAPAGSAVIAETADGLGTWRYTLPADGSVTAVPNRQAAADSSGWCQRDRRQLPVAFAARSVLRVRGAGGDGRVPA